MIKVDEIWKDIPGYEGIYSISEYGNIVRIGAKRGTFIGKGIKAHPDFKGYLKVIITNGIKAKSYRVHRLVGLTFIKNPLRLPQINHIDLNKQNNHFSNLEWCSNIENKHHAMRNGIIPRVNLGKFGKNHNRSIPIIGTNITTGEEVLFEGGGDAARRLKLLHCCIGKCVIGMAKTTGGWKFRKA